jgi:hypothetical protein
MGKGGLMKHDELLIHLMVLKPEETIETRAVKLNNAIRAVLELHKPYPSKPHKPDGVLFCQQCTDYSTVNWPCGTIRAIEKELA